MRTRWRNAKARRLGLVRPNLAVTVCLLLLGCLLLVGCGAQDPYVWAQSLPPSPGSANTGDVIGIGDLLDIRVYGNPDLSGKARVRADGRITLPLVGDVAAADKTPAALSQEIQTRVQQFVKVPAVTVGIDEAHTLNIVVLGEVARPGVIQVPRQAGILAVLALAGGFTENADRESIFLKRQRPALRVRFSYHRLTTLGGEAAAAFRLENGDVVTVE